VFIRNCFFFSQRFDFFKQTIEANSNSGLFFYFNLFTLLVKAGMCVCMGACVWARERECVCLCGCGLAEHVSK